MWDNFRNHGSRPICWQSHSQNLKAKLRYQMSNSTRYPQYQYSSTVPTAHAVPRVPTYRWYTVLELTREKLLLVSVPKSKSVTVQSTTLSVHFELHQYLPVPRHQGLKLLQSLVSEYWKLLATQVFIDGQNSLKVNDVKRIRHTHGIHIPLYSVELLTKPEQLDSCMQQNYIPLVTSVSGP